MPTSNKRADVIQLRHPVVNRTDPVDNGGGGGNNGGMEETRIRKLEDAVLRIDAKLEHLVTHKDLHDLTWKLIGAMVTAGTALTAAVYFIATHARP